LNSKISEKYIDERAEENGRGTVQRDSSSFAFLEAGKALGLKILNQFYDLMYIRDWYEKIPIRNQP